MNKEAYSRTENSQDIWETDPAIFHLLNKEFKFTLDPCATPETAKCRNFFTKEENGLIQDWSGHVVFVNPPYSQIKHWVRKCYKEGKKENTKIVMLIPIRSDTIYFHKYIIKAKELRFIKGRVNFLSNGERKGSSTFPSILVIFEGKHQLPLISDIFIHKENDLANEHEQSNLYSRMAKYTHPEKYKKFKSQHLKREAFVEEGYEKVKMVLEKLCKKCYHHFDTHSMNCIECCCMGDILQKLNKDLAFPRNLKKN